MTQVEIRRATVLGGAGFIGRYVVQRLARRGAVVTVVSRHASRARFLQPMGGVGQIALIDASLADEPALAAAIAGADAVVNAVGILAEGGGQRFAAIQHEGAQRIARLAAAAGVRHLVHLSAIGADPASPSAYAASKAAGEAAMRAAFPPATILRPSVVFGAEDQFFNRFAEMTRLAPVLPLIGGGRTRFQPVHVGDVADAVMAALDQPAAHGRTFELGGPRVMSFREVLELLCRVIGRPGILLLPVPFPLAGLLALLTGWLPGAPLTRDQLILLRRDNVVAAGARSFADLGLAPTPAEAILPTYLARFRPPSVAHAGTASGPKRP